MGGACSAGRGLGHACHSADLGRPARIPASHHDGLGRRGLLRGSWGDIIDHALVSFTDYVLLGLIAGISLWRRWSLRYALFFILCALGGFSIINHNEQRWGILALHAGAIVAAGRILREGDGPRPPILGNSAGATLLVLVMMLPTILHNGIALGLHVTAAVTGAGGPCPFRGWRGAACRPLDRWRLRRREPVSWHGRGWHPRLVGP
ncbi:hypothetical protein ACFSYD_17695 [Paracoccus aerius]